MKTKAYSTLVALAACCSLFTFCDQNSNKPAGEGQGQKAPGFIEYVAMDSSVFVADSTVEKWQVTFDDPAIEQHAWALWGAITAKTNQKYPVKDTADKYNIEQVQLTVFNTWWDEFETFSPPKERPEHNAMRYHLPRQVSASPGQSGPEVHGGDEVISFNKYSQEFVDYVDRHHLYYLKTLCDMNEQMAKDKVPQEKRVIPTDFDGKSVMLKPTYWVVKNDRPNLLPYWKGPVDEVNGTTYPDRPMSLTWTQFIVFNPTKNKIPEGTPFTRSMLGRDGKYKDTTVTSYEVVGREHFYWVPLTATDIAYIRKGLVFTIGGIPADSLVPGDMALLVGCHVTSVESRNWTWQTFWWTPHPARKAPASANVKGPFNNFDMSHAYYMLNSKGKHHVAFNPYLETPIITPIIIGNNIDKGLGRNSNCMTCHHAAAFPTMNMDPSFANMLTGSYVGSGTLKPTNQIFNGRIQTKFMWGLLMQLQGRTDASFQHDSMSVYPNSGFQY